MFCFGRIHAAVTGKRCLAVGDAKNAHLLIRQRLAFACVCSSYCLGFNAHIFQRTCTSTRCKRAHLVCVCALCWLKTCSLLVEARAVQRIWDIVLWWLQGSVFQSCFVFRLTCMMNGFTWTDSRLIGAYCWLLCRHTAASCIGTRCSPFDYSCGTELAFNCCCCAGGDLNSTTAMRSMLVGSCLVCAEYALQELFGKWFVVLARVASALACCWNALDVFF
jgi:hypothetical protein